MAESKRSLVAHYIDTTPSASETYVLMGEGVSEAQMAMNPQSETEQYVHEDVATTRVASYQPNMTIDQVVYPGNDLFDYIDSLRQAGPSIGGDDITTLVEVRLYETGGTDGVTYPATKWNVQVQIDNAPGGAGGANARIGYTLNVQGAATDGDFNTSTLAFS